jgi:hypothetical protein
MTTIRKTISGAVAALALTATVAASATPAAADWRGHRGGWGGGHRGGAIAAGVIGGLALGALAAGSTRAYAAPTYYAPAYEPVYGGCVREDQPTYNRWGRFIGYRAVTVCD